MADRIDRLIDAAIDRWSTPGGLALALMAATALLVSTLTQVNFAALSPAKLTVIAVALSGLTAAWFFTRLPRSPKNKVGFGIAIHCEDPAHAQRIKADLVVSLRELVTGKKFKYEFHFIEYSQAVAQRITDAKRAIAVAERSNLKFLLFGRARKRTLAEGPSHLIDVQYLVGHAPISRDASRHVEADFGSVVPTRFVFGEQGDVLHLEFAARHLDAVARYVIGTAAAVSNDFPFAEQLLLDAEQKLQLAVERAEGQVVAALLARVQNRVAELYTEWLSRAVRKAIATRDPALLPQQEELARKLRKYRPNDYIVRVNAALTAFELRRDIKTAKRELAACRKVPDATWRYGEAFLFAYEGDLQQAYLAYRGAFAAPLLDISVPTQCEEFIEAVLRAEPDKYWLYFCLGLINYRAKGDLVSARSDFQHFVDSAVDGRFAPQIVAAKQWIREIDALLA